MFDWTTKSVLITGAGGFLGSHLAETLVRMGARTRALVHYNALGTRGWLDASPLGGEMEVIAADVCDSRLMHRAMRDIDVVFHLAALIGVPYSYHATASYVRVNIEGTLNTLEAARDASVERFIQTSTSQVYGTAQEVPISEAHPLQAQSPYSASKIAADKLAESFHRSFDLPVTAVRLFCTFGPRQSTRAIVPTIITQLLRGRRVCLGNISPTRDYNFVTDSMRAFILAAITEAAIGRTMNIGGCTEISIRDLARTLGRLIGHDEIEIVSAAERSRPRGSEVERLLADTTLARRILGWEPKIPQEEAFRQTIEWYRRHLDRFHPLEHVV
jgi:dTDP-glucose 4,6-dehydratase